jgi:hypothetical protein
MSKRQFHFAAIAKITLEHETGAPTSVLKASDLRLEVSGNLDRSVYIDGKGLPRKEALKPISNALVMGLITNMRMGAAKGWWKEGEHMRYVIDQLQRAFVHPGEDPGESTMEY